MSNEPLLKGLNVVEMATWRFGPMSAGVLGELGADVIKLEPHEGDPMRGLIHRVRDDGDWVFEIANRQSLQRPRAWRALRDHPRGAWLPLGPDWPAQSARRHSLTVPERFRYNRSSSVSRTLCSGRETRR